MFFGSEGNRFFMQMFTPCSRGLLQMFTSCSRPNTNVTGLFKANCKCSRFVHAYVLLFTPCSRVISNVPGLFTPMFSCSRRVHGQFQMFTPCSRQFSRVHANVPAFTSRSRLFQCSRMFPHVYGRESGMLTWRVQYIT